MPSPLDKTLLHLSFTPAPACILRLRLTTHILFDCGLDIAGRSGRFLLMASASALVRAFLLAEPPGMLKVVMPFLLLVVTSSEASVLLSVSKETRAFIPNYDVIKPRFGNYDLIDTQSDWLLGSSDWLLSNRGDT